MSSETPATSQVNTTSDVDQSVQNQKTKIVAALYQFHPIDEVERLQKLLLSVCLEQGIKGTLLLAHEGINGTISGTRGAIDVLKKTLIDEGFHRLMYKESLADFLPFYRMKVKIKPEIVTMGVGDIDVAQGAGHYVKPADWNDLIQQPDVLLIDTRNDYEYQVGTFVGAENPDTENFRQFPEYVKSRLDPQKHRKVAMFCTGGIRCEKATAYVKTLGIEQVYHLEGGILQYLEDVPAEQSLWQGECFVFDNRVTVNHDLEPGLFDMCHGCRRPITEADKASQDYERGVHCPYCVSELTQDQRERFRERQKQMDLARTRDQQHLGVNPRDVATK